MKGIVNKWWFWVVVVALLAWPVYKVGTVLIETATEAAKIDALRPEVADALRAARADLLDQGMKTLVGQTKRTADEESAAVARGSSATHNSFHVLGRAVDLYPYDPDTGEADMNGVNVDLFKQMHAVLANYGFTNIAFNADGSKKYITTSKGKVWDGGHAQFTNGMTFAQAAVADGYEG